MTTFNIPVRMMDYKDGSFRYVCDNEITLGQELFIKFDKAGKNITGFVNEIIEQRKSKGTFKGNIPFSAKVVFK